MTTIDLTAAIEAGAWALIDSDTDVVDRGVSEDHYGQRLDDAKIALTAALPHIEQQVTERVKPSRDEIARALHRHATDDGEVHVLWGGADEHEEEVSEWLPFADAILALLPGKSEAEVKAEALREAHECIRKSDTTFPGMTAGDALRFLMSIADAIERGEGL